MTYVQNKARYAETTASWQSFGGSNNSTITSLLMPQYWSDEISRNRAKKREGEYNSDSSAFEYHLCNSDLTRIAQR